MPSNISPVRRITEGIFGIIMGLAVYLWARNHPPQMFIMGPNDWCIPEPIYSIILLLAALFGIFGIVELAIGMFEQTKSRDSLNNIINTPVINKRKSFNIFFCSQCGKPNEKSSKFCQECGNKLDS